MKVSDALARVGGYGLPGAKRVPVRIERFSELMDLADTQRMLPWLSEAVEDGLVENVSDADREHLRSRTLVAVQTTLAVHSAAASVITRLADIGLTDIRVLKGCATSYLDYAPLGQRYTSDVDILVRPNDLERALSVFQSERIPVPRRASWQRRYGKATAVSDDSGVEIDIHTTLTDGYFGLVLPVGELMAGSERFSVGGVEMLALDGPRRLIHAANHVGGPGFVGMHSARDVLQLALQTEVNWEESVDLAECWGVDGLFASGVNKAWAQFDIEGHPLLDWARDHQVAGRQRLAFRAIGDRPRGHYLTAPLALPIHRWPGYVWPLAFPSREYMEENHKFWLTRARSILHEVWSN